MAVLLTWASESQIRTDRNPESGLVRHALIELAAQAKRFKARPEINDGVNLDADDGLQANERSLSADIAIENARKNAKDVLLNEAAAILADGADLQKSVR